MAARCCVCGCPHSRASLFFFNDTATTEIYTLSLHDALPISASSFPPCFKVLFLMVCSCYLPIANCSLNNSSAVPAQNADRKSTRLNSSHSQISYAVFCLKKDNRRRGPNPRLVQHRHVHIDVH